VTAIEPVPRSLAGRLPAWTQVTPSQTFWDIIYYLPMPLVIRLFCLRLHFTFRALGCHLSAHHFVLPVERLPAQQPLYRISILPGFRQNVASSGTLPTASERRGERGCGVIHAFLEKG
jgi:hypothetical protein